MRIFALNQKTKALKNKPLCPKKTKTHFNFTCETSFFTQLFQPKTINYTE